MRTRTVIIIGALAAAGCASSQTNGQPAAAEAETETQPLQKPGRGGGMMMGGEMSGMCPMAVEGTAARAEEVQGGTALVFTTSGDVADLRRRVAGMAEMHNQHHSEGHMGGKPGRGAGGGDMPGGMGQMGGMMGEGMMMVPATARSEEVEGGARLVLTPRDPAELGKLREQVRRHAEHMAPGQCPMMMMGDEGAEAAPSKPSEHEGHHPPGGN